MFNPLTQEDTSKKDPHKICLKNALRGLYKNICVILEPWSDNQDVLNLFSSLFLQLLEKLFESVSKLQADSSEVVAQLLEVIIELSLELKGLLRQQIFTLILCQKEVWSLILKNISNGIGVGPLDSKGSRSLKVNGTQNADRLLLFVETLLVYFRSKANTDYIASMLKTYYNGNLLDQYMKDLLAILTTELNKLKFLELAYLNDPAIDQIINSILQIYEKCYLYEKVKNLKGINEAQKIMKLLENQLPIKENKNSSNSQSLDTESLTEKRLALENLLLIHKSTIQDLEDLNQTLDAQFSSQLRFYSLFYSFEHVKKYSKARHISFENKNMNSIIYFLRRLCYETLKESGYNSKMELKDLMSRNLYENFKPLDGIEMKNGTFSKLLTLQNYLNRLIKFLGDSIDTISFEEIFIWHIYHVSLVLIYQLTAQIKKQPLIPQEMLVLEGNDIPQLEGLIADISKIFLRYLTDRDLQREVSSSTVAISMLNWTRMVVDFENLIQESLKNSAIHLTKDSLYDLVNIAFRNLQNGSDYDEKFIQNELNILLLIYSTSSGSHKKSGFNSLAFLLDDLFESFFELEVLIETKVKQIFMRSRDKLCKHGLSYLKKILLTNEKDAIFSEKLASLILGKFKVSSDIQDHSDLSHLHVSLGKLIISSYPVNFL